MTFEKRYKNCELVPTDLTEELLTSLKGMLITFYAPNYWPTQGDRTFRKNCVRRVCKGYVAQASLLKGLTIRGQSHFNLSERDVDKICVNMKHHSLDVLCEYVNIVLSGINDRRLEPDPGNSGGHMSCAFG